MPSTRTGRRKKIANSLLFLGVITVIISAVTLAGAIPREVKDERKVTVQASYIAGQPSYFKTESVLTVGRTLEGNISLPNVSEPTRWSNRMFVMTEDQFISWDSSRGLPTKSLYESGENFVYYGRTRSFVLPIHLVINSTQKYYFVLSASGYAGIPMITLNEKYIVEATVTDLSPLVSNAFGVLSGISLATVAIIEKRR
jgi:hypothetical protein